MTLMIFARGQLEGLRSRMTRKALSAGIHRVHAPPQDAQYDARAAGKVRFEQRDTAHRLRILREVADFSLLSRPSGGTIGCFGQDHGQNGQSIKHPEERSFNTETTPPLSKKFRYAGRVAGRHTVSVPEYIEYHPAKTMPCEDDAELYKMVSGATWIEVENH
ncbi:MAG: hypothetical protein V1766_05400 [Pseudomonadota bacterium]